MSITATTDTPCPCCAPCTSGAISCRTRGGTATLCGYSEFLTAASTPPKKYRKVHNSGQFFICYHHDSCSGAMDTVDSYDFDGADDLIYDAATCVVNTGHYTHYVHSGGGALTCEYQTTGTATVEVAGVFSTGLATETTTQGTITRTLTTAEEVFFGTGACLPSGSLFYNIFGSQKQELSVEDTEADAITRLLAGAGGTWSSYTTPGDGHCGASWEARTSSFSFAYHEGGFRVNASALVPSTDYLVYVDIYRRTYGVGSYALFQTLTLSGTSDGSGNLQIDGDVPNARGFESYAVMGSCPP